MSTQPNDTSTPATFGLSRDPFGQLILINSEGERHVGVIPVRLFPFTDALQWVSLVGPGNKELMLIEDLTQLPKHLRETIDEELRNREFMPVIEQVTHCSSDTEPSEWHVQTDRGATRFVLKSEDDIRTLAPGKLLIIDAIGMRYIVPDFRKLDSYSRRVLEEYA
jgi:hypothetical protein